MKYQSFSLCMNISLLGTQIAITDALREKVYREFARLEKILDPAVKISVEIGKTTNHHNKGEIFKAEAKIVEPKAQYYADIITEDLYVSIDTLVDELFEQVTKSKSRHRTLLRRGQSIIKKLLRLS
jgi:ribosomal subunit interface protein